MATFRIETIADEDSGLIFVEAFHEPGHAPVIRSKPTYATHEEAEADVLKMMGSAWPDRYPFAVDPSIGV
jgi:hypothetical protein